MQKALLRLDSAALAIFFATALGAGGGCSDPGTDGAETGGTSTGGTGGSATGGAGTGGAVTGGTGGSTTGGAGTGGAATGGDGSGGSDTSDCTPNPSGTFVASEGLVFDEKTCLTWQQSNTSGEDYAAAVAACEALEAGGYDDFRLPTAGEVVSIFKCDNTYPPLAAVFTANGDGIWTTTESGTIAGDQPKVCGAGQSNPQFYDFGKVGPQHTRCVRGVVTLPDRTDCKTNTQICSN